MNFRNRPARVAAATGAVVVAGAATMLAVAAGTAAADEPGRCVQNVNIREEPDATSRIVALCEAGTQVKLGAERDGWVRIDELGGWASKDYVKADETPSPDSSGASDPDASSSSGGSSGDNDSAGSDSASSDSGGSNAAGDHSDGADDRRSSGDDGGTPDHTSGAGERPSANVATSGHTGLLGGLLR